MTPLTYARQPRNAPDTTPRTAPNAADNTCLAAFTPPPATSPMIITFCSKVLSSTWGLNDVVFPMVRIVAEARPEEARAFSNRAPRRIDHSAVQRCQNYFSNYFLNYFLNYLLNYL